MAELAQKQFVVSGNFEGTIKKSVLFKDGPMMHQARVWMHIILGNGALPLPTRFLIVQDLACAVHIASSP